MVLPLTLLCCRGVLHAQTNDEMMRRLDALQQQVTRQQELLDRLLHLQETQMQQTTAVIQREVQTATKEARDELAKSETEVLSLREGIAGLSLTGDLRLRYEQIDTDAAASGKIRYKSRFRHRIRLGGLWKNPDESWEIGLGMEAGSSDGTSANQSWNDSKTWKSGSIYLDYAYAKHTFGDSGISLTLGQQKNPWRCSMLTYDADLRPTGATLTYGSDTFFGTLGAYNIRGDAKITDSDDQSLANMFAGQAGMKYKRGDLHALLALGFFWYDDKTSEFQLGNEDATFRIGALYGEVGTKAGAFDIKGIAEFALNFGTDRAYSQGVAYGQASDDTDGYDPDDNNLAWLLGVQGTYGKFSTRYAYVYIEGDAIPWFVSDSTFGAGALLSSRSINVQGHILGLSYNVTQHFWLSGTLMFPKLIEPSDSGKDSGRIYLLDANYRF